MYFKLNSYVYIVIGEEEGCLYNLQNAHIYKFTSNVANKIIDLENGITVEEVGLDEEIIQQLIDWNLGELYERNVYINKIRYGVSQNVKNRMFQQNRIHSLFIQVENNCNMDCNFCDSYSCNRITGCRKYTGECTMSVENYDRLIKEAGKLGCTRLTILGGEPLLKKELVVAIIKSAKSNGYREIYMYTNGYLLDEEFVHENNDVKYIVQCLASEQELLDKINRNKQDITEFIHKIELLSNNNVDYVIYLTLTHENYIHKNKIIDFFGEYKPSKIIYNYIYQESNDSKYNKILRCNSFEDDIRIQDKQFLHNLDNHPCLFGKITIFANGDIGICPMMRNHVISNFFEEKLSQTLIENKQEKYWKLSLDKINICGKCAMRYACFDCRAIEEARTGQLDGKYYCEKV